MFTVKLELGGANLKGARFQQQAASLSVSAESLYAALVADAENLPPNMDLQGRQVDAWKQYRAFRVFLARHLLSFPSFPRLLACGCPQDHSGFSTRTRCIPGTGGTHSLSRLSGSIYDADYMK